MKKLILLNAILLAFLFSIKFSGENLAQNLYARIKMSPFLKDSGIDFYEISSVDGFIEKVDVEKARIEELPLNLSEIPFEPYFYTKSSIPDLLKEDLKTHLDEQVSVASDPKIETQTSLNEEPKDLAADHQMRPRSVKEDEPPLAQKLVEKTNTAFSPPQKESDYSHLPLPKRIALSHTEGYGEHDKTYRTNYSLAEIIFAPDVKIGSLLPMIDFRGYRFNNGKFAISSGLVMRYIPDIENSFCELLGLNLYYDFAPDTPGYHQQLGVGVEILGKRLDFRANFFAPFGGNDNQGFCCSRKHVNGWISSGFNAEIGYYALKTKSFSLYTAAGPYYMTACKCKERERGLSLRVFPQYKDYIGLNLKYTYDPLFRSIFQAEIIVSLPFYEISKVKKSPCGITTQQIYQRVERR